MSESILKKAEKHLARIVEIRRHLHRNPELSNGERKTAAFVAGELERLDMEVRRNVGGGNGVTGLLRGARPGRTIALRADMDALPLTEATGLEFASGNAGVMHACGHDMHMAILLGAAMTLAGMREQLAGNVKFAFQPAEELSPPGGAAAMITGGALEDPKVDAMLALHVWPRYKCGTVNCRPGPFMAAVDKIELAALGRSAHGAAPHLGVDAIAIASQIVGALQTIVARNVAPADMAVVTIGTIHGGVKDNIIADRVDLEGTVRTFNSLTQDMIERKVGEIAKSVARGMGGDCESRYLRGYPALFNDAGMVEELRAAATDELGADAWHEPPHPDMTAEDFAYFAQKVPAAMFWLGCTPEDADPEMSPQLHNVCFAPDEKCMLPGVRVLVAAATRLLSPRVSGSRTVVS